MNATMGRIVRDARELAIVHKEKLPYAVAAIACLLVYAISHSREGSVSVFRTEGAPDFKDARILGSNGESLYEGKERLLSKTMKEILASQTALKESNVKLQAKLEELEKGHSAAGPTPVPSQAASDSGQPGNQTGGNGALLAKDPVRVSPPSESLSAYGASDYSTQSSSYGGSRGYRSSRRESGGASIISFPVKDIPIEKTEGIALPAGSYVKAKLMTGVEAPEGKTYPVLLQLDYAYIIPNNKKLDLAGCFMIAKSQGDLSTERVQMQATKLSCVSKTGRMFEREVNGFVADDKDNSFAVMGSVNSKQDRVAAMAFMSSVVEGVGKAIQAAQTTQQTNALGGSQAVVTGDSMSYMAAGGASNAASMVTQWYLKQAQNLLPTINVGSGQNVWIVMQDKVALPSDYFRKTSKGDSHESVYTYFSRLVD